MNYHGQRVPRLQATVDDSVAVRATGAAGFASDIMGGVPEEQDSIGEYPHSSRNVDLNAAGAISILVHVVCGFQRATLTDRQPTSDIDDTVGRFTQAGTNTDS